MNFSRVKPTSWIGKAVRLPLRLIPPNAVLPILQGRLRGMRWIAGSSINGCWLGSYEFEKQALFAHTIRPGSVVFDVGAHAGFYTLLASVLAGDNGKVFAFEPLPQNVAFIQRHLQLNRVTNTTILELAMSNISGAARFDAAGHRSMGRLSPSGKVDVRVSSLDQLWRGGLIPLPDFIKMDIEGGEVLALAGAREILAASHPVIFLATHGAAVHQECCRALIESGYRLSPIDGQPLETSREILAE